MRDRMRGVERGREEGVRGWNDFISSGGRGKNSW